MKNATKLMFSFKWDKKILLLFTLFLFSLTYSVADVNSYSGSFSIEETDLFIRFHTIEIDISRNYSSIASYSVDQTGNWIFLPFHKRIIVTEDKNQLLLQDGKSLIEFKKSDEEGIYRTRKKDQIKTIFSGFSRDLKNGGFELYHEDGKLKGIHNPGGRGLMFYYDGDNLKTVMSGAIEILKYIRNEQGQIKQIKTYRGLTSEYQYNEKGLLANAKNEDNVTTYYEYDDSDRLSQVKFQTGDFIKIQYYKDTGVVEKLTKQDGITSYEYQRDDNGNIKKTTIAYPHGVETIKFENEGKVFKSTDVAGNQSESHFNEDGLMSRYIDPNGHSVSYEYDSLGRLVQVIQPDGSTLGYSYLGDTLLIKREILADSSTRLYFYNKKKQLVRTIEPDGFEISFEYDEEGRLITEFYGNGKNRFIKHYVYDGAGFLIKETDSLGRVSKYTRDTRGRIKEILNPIGEKWRFKYTQHGMLEEISDLSQVLHSYKYDDSLRLVELRGKRGLPVRFSYDSSGVLERMTYPSGKIETYQYDSCGRIKSVLDSRGCSRSYEYNKMGFITKETSPAGVITNSLYDAVGNLKEIDNNLGYEKKFIYDKMNRVKTVLQPGGFRYDYVYDRGGRLFAEKDVYGRVKSYLYNSSGNMVKVILPNGEETLFEYDSKGLGTITAVKTADGRKILYEYDPAGREIRQETPWGEIIRYFYDKNNNLVQVDSSSGKTINYQYDLSGRLSKLESSDGYVESYEYNAQGDVIKIKAKDFKKIISYDDFGDVVSEEYPLLGKKVIYAYDQRRNRKSISLADDLEIQYEHDNLERLIAVKYGSDKKILMSHDKLGRKTKITYPNGVKIKYFYNNLDLYERIIYSDITGKILEEYQYKYDIAGKLKKITDLGGRTKEFSYDENGQLIQVSSNGKRIFYKYGPSFMKLAQSDEREEKHFRYNSSGQMTEAGSTRLDYDLSGNMSNKFKPSSPLKYDFDALGRLSSIQSSIKNVRYTYSPQGLRSSKSINDDKTHYVYDRYNLLMELDKSKNIEKVFIHAQEIDSPLVMLQGEEEYYYLPDHLGSTIAILDKSGKIVTRYEYDAFGNITAKKETDVGNPLTYAGRYYDSESGLLYYRARYYDPELGVFVSPDPYIKSCMYPRVFNDYAYVGNDPLNQIDPFGLQPQGYVPHDVPDIGIKMIDEAMTRPTVFSYDDVYSDAFWTKVRNDYQWLKKSFPRSNWADTYQDRLVKNLANMRPKPPPIEPYQPDMLDRAIEVGGRAKNFAVGKAKSFLSKLRRGFKPHPSQVGTIKIQRPDGITNGLGTGNQISGATRGGSKLLKGAKILGKGAGAAVTIGLSYFRGKDIGRRYVAKAGEEGRIPSGRDQAIASAEAGGRTYLAIKTLGGSEVVILWGQNFYDRYRLHKNMKAEAESLKRLKNLEMQAGKKLKDFLVVAAKYLLEAGRIKLEQEDAIQEAKSWSEKAEQNAQEVLALIPKLASILEIKKSYLECSEHIENLWSISPDVLNRKFSLDKNRGIAKSESEKACDNPSSPEAAASVNRARNAAKAAKNLLKEIYLDAEKAKELGEKIRALISKREELIEADSELETLWNDLLIALEDADTNAENSEESSIYAKRCVNQCARLENSVLTIYNRTKAAETGALPTDTDPTGSAVASYLQQIRVICREISVKANKGETYATAAQLAVEKLSNKITPLSQAMDSKAGIMEAWKNIELPPEDFAESFKRDSEEAAKIVQEVQKYAEKAERCVGTGPEPSEGEPGALTGSWEGIIQELRPRVRPESYIEFNVTQAGDTEIKVTFPRPDRDPDPERFIELDWQIKTVDQKTSYARQGYPLHFSLRGNSYQHEYKETKTKKVGQLGNLIYTYVRFITLNFVGDRVTGEITESLVAHAVTDDGKKVPVKEMVEGRRVNAKRIK